MRTRQTGSATLGSATYREQRSSSNSGSTWSSWTRTDYPAGTIGTYSKTTSDEVTAGYHTLLKKGSLIPHTNFHQVEAEELWSLGSLAGMYKTSSTGRIEFRWPSGVYGALSSANPIPPRVTISNYINNATAEAALQKATADVSTVGIDGLTFLAELVKLRKLFQDVIKHIFQIIYRWREYREVLLSVPGMWLEARFGLRPLVSDLENILSMSRNLNRMQTKIYKSSKRIEGIVDLPDTETVVTSGDAKCTVTSKFTTSASYSGSCAAMIRNGGFGFNPIATAWELLPFSFVLDWFFSIGNAILAGQTLFLSKELTSSYGWMITIDEQRTQTLVPGGGGTYLALNGSSTVTRSTILTQRVPSAATLIPQMRYNIDAAKGVDAAALLFSMLQGIGYVPRK